MMTTEIDSKFTNNVEVSLARIEERQLSTSKEIHALKESVTTQVATFRIDYDHRLNNLKQAQLLFLPEKEINFKIEALKNECESQRKPLHDRILNIEENIKYYSRWFLVLCAGGGAGLIAVIWGILSKAIHLGVAG